MSDKVGILDDKVQISQILFGEWGEFEPCIRKIDATFRLQPSTLERRPANLQQRAGFIHPFNSSADETVINPNSMAGPKLVDDRWYARDVSGSRVFGDAARYGFTCEIQHISGTETDIHRIGADRADGAYLPLGLVRSNVLENDTGFDVGAFSAHCYDFTFADPLLNNEAPFLYSYVLKADHLAGQKLL